MAVYIVGLINIVYSNRSNIKVKLSAIVTIALIPSILCRVIKALATRVISPNNKFLINRLN